MDIFIGLLYATDREEISVPIFALSGRVLRPSLVNPSVWTNLSRRNVLWLILKQLTVTHSCWLYWISLNFQIISFKLNHNTFSRLTFWEVWVPQKFLDFYLTLFYCPSFVPPPRFVWNVILGRKYCFMEIFLPKLPKSSELF